MAGSIRKSLFVDSVSIVKGEMSLSALELYLKEAQKVKGTWHKLIIQRLRDYMTHETEEDLISAIHKIQDNDLLLYLWEAGLSQTLQDVANKRSMYLAARDKIGGEQ